MGEGFMVKYSNTHNLSLFFKVYVHVCGRVHAHVSEGGHGVQKRALDPWELDLQAVVSHPMLVLGTEITKVLLKSSTCS